jgi:hypothetical protein
VREGGLGVVLPDVFVRRERVVQGHDNFEILSRPFVLCVDVQSNTPVATRIEKDDSEVRSLIMGASKTREDGNNG